MKLKTKYHRITDFIYILIVLLIMSCTNYEKSFFDNGKLKFKVPLDKSGKKNGVYREYHNTGDIKIISHYKGGKLIDSSLFYNLNNQLSTISYFIKDSILVKEFKGDTIAIGCVLDGVKIGNWDYYLGNKKFKRENYTLLTYPEQKSHLNQILIFNDKDSLNPLKSKFYSVEFPNNIIVNKDYLIKVKFNFPKLNKRISDNSEKIAFLMLSEKMSNNFTTPKGSKLDTVVPLSQGEFKFVYNFRNSGKQNFRGIIHSYLFTVGKDSTDINIGEILIDKQIEVKGETKISKNE
jgi:antitoxin component YwqK of YwqJK toxin-antitoxin module